MSNLGLWVKKKSMCCHLVLFCHLPLFYFQPPPLITAAVSWGQLLFWEWVWQDCQSLPTRTLHSSMILPFFPVHPHGYGCSLIVFTFPRQCEDVHAFSGVCSSSSRGGVCSSARISRSILSVVCSFSPDFGWSVGSPRVWSVRFSSRAGGDCLSCSSSCTSQGIHLGLCMQRTGWEDVISSSAWSRYVFPVTSFPKDGLLFFHML